MCLGLLEGWCHCLQRDMCTALGFQGNILTVGQFHAVGTASVKQNYKHIPLLRKCIVSETLRYSTSSSPQISHKQIFPEHGLQKLQCNKAQALSTTNPILHFDLQSYHLPLCFWYSCKSPSCSCHQNEGIDRVEALAELRGAPPHSPKGVACWKSTLTKKKTKWDV